MDTIGPIARTALDAALVFDAVADPEPERPAGPYSGRTFGRTVIAALVGTYVKSCRPPAPGQAGEAG